MKNVLQKQEILLTQAETPEIMIIILAIILVMRKSRRVNSQRLGREGIHT